MAEHGSLLAYYFDPEDALAALRQLRRIRFRRAALIHKDSQGRIHYDRSSYTRPIILRAAASVIMGISLGAAALFAVGREAPWVAAVAAGAPVVASLAAVWLLLRRADLRGDLIRVRKHASWLVPDETALLLHAPPRELGRLVPHVRQLTEAQPSIFPLQPARHLESAAKRLQKVPLPPAQVHQHASHLAEGHQLEESDGRREPLLRWLERSATVIETVRQDLVDADRLEQGISPAAEWLLDNGHIIHAHINDVRRNLPRRFYHRLPLLASGPQKGLPRVYSLAAELVLHTDGRLDRLNIEDFLEAYQAASPLRISELWAMPLMLRIALIESLRSLAQEADRRLHERELADFWANRLLATARREPHELFAKLAELAREVPHPSSYFAAQTIGHLYDEGSALVPVQSWLERELQSPLGEIVSTEQARQAADRVSIANAITSLRDLSLLDWRQVFESQSIVEGVLRADPAGVYARMNFDTRDQYRQAVEEIARSADRPEQAVALAALEMASPSTRDRPSRRAAHVGTYLVGEGRPSLIQSVDGRETLRNRALTWIYRHHTLIYLGSITLFTVLIMLPPVWLGYVLERPISALHLVLALLALLPASQLSVQLVNYLITRILPPRRLPKMSFEAQGIPDEFKTLVVVPVILSDVPTTREEIETLEIRYLANPDDNLIFSLFTDFPDADQPERAADTELLQAAEEGIAALNQRYGGERFMLFHRERQWCPSEGAYIGWERKRGKLEQLNRAIAGGAGAEEAGIVQLGDPARLVDIRFVITLDSDTQLPSGSARRMIETLAHPLNDPRDGNLAPGSLGAYTIVQPRVSTSLPSATATPFSRIFTDPVGVDPYTKAVSDAYHDLSGQGSYHGKGIYDPRAFDRALGGRFPEQRLLSHDLIEGAHVRVGLASDIELFDEFPPDYLTYVRRQHRWIRGDWQIADWVLPRVPGPGGERVPNPLSLLNRWKVMDNLRRSLVPVGCLGFLIAAWMSSPALGIFASVMIGVLLLFNPLVHPVTWATSTGAARESSWHTILRDLTRSVFEAVLLPHQAAVALDAILRVGYRRLISGRRLLEWTTAQMAAWTSGDQLRASLVHMGFLSLFSSACALVVWRFAPGSLPAALPYLLLWFISPLVAWRLNRVFKLRASRAQLRPAQVDSLRVLARRTWRYFEDFVSEESAWLPPDNYQVSHKNQLAMRTSPTNIGLWTLTALGARDFGYLTGTQVLERLSHTFETLSDLERFEGHLLNWYDLTTLRPLEPRYVSSVDSGNLLASLWTLLVGIDELLDAPLVGPQAVRGLADTLAVLREELTSGELERAEAHDLAILESLFDEVPTGLEAIVNRLRRAHDPASRLADGLRLSAGVDAGPAYWARQLERQISAWQDTLDRLLPWLDALFALPDDQLVPERVFGTRETGWHAPSLRALAGELTPALTTLKPSMENPSSSPWDPKLLRDSSKLASQLLERAEELMGQISQLAGGINMGFLYDTQRRLFSIGYNVSAGNLDGSYYDLLASEARLGSFVAIARGDVPHEHWLAMGRPFGTVNGRRALLSWSGTMFEYLMPNLLQESYENSLLAMANRVAVGAQVEYGRRRGVPWGMSESAYADLDLNKTYQYKAFGVPGLGLKRGLAEDLVVAPYATLLALEVEPQAAMANLERLAEMGLSDGYGMFEAIDFARQRQREGGRGVLVRAYMAHHQAMGFLALANLIHDGSMRRRFHANQQVKAAVPLLHERIPVLPPLYYISSREAPPPRLSQTGVAPSASKFDTPHSPVPKTQLLSNGNYALMVTSAGGGYSRWRDFDLTRWRSDTTRDSWGTFCYFRDISTGRVWSNGYHPVGGGLGDYRVEFAVDRAMFTRLDGAVETKTDIVVSPEDDAEIRRIALINRSGRRKEIEITSYVELAMAPHAADKQHPAFQKLFVATKAVRRQGSLYAHRRPRSPDDPPIYVVHRMTFEQDYAWAIEYETDRLAFIGRGRTLANPIALERPLTNSEGFVLDPIFSLRRTVSLEPGERVQFALVMAAAETRARALAISEFYSDARAIERALELAWVNTQLELRSLRVQPDEARRFQKLASHMLYPSAPLRPAAERLAQNRHGQTRLWPYGISGDLPIAAVTIGEARDIGLVRQMLQAHTYWRQHGLIADLLILNEESSSYDGVLNEQLKQLVRAHSMYTGVDQPGGIFLRSVDQIPEEDLTLMLSAARVWLVAARGPLTQQLAGLFEPIELPEELSPRSISEEPSAALPYEELIDVNGLGGFTPDGREYVITLGRGKNTPAPWVNVMSNPEFGALVSESGSGFTWYGNSQRNRLTGWSNDPVVDPPSEAIFIRDLETGTFWSPTPLPIRENDPYRIRHGAGYTLFEHNSHAIQQELSVFVPMDERGGDPIRLQRLRLKSDLSRRCRLSVTFYLDWTMGEDREASQMHVVTRWDEEMRALLASNHYHPDYPERIAFAAISPASEIYTADRTEFIGRNRSLVDPAAMARVELSGRTGAGLDPCAALQVEIELAPGQSAEVTCMLGQAGSRLEARELVRKYREPLGVDQALSNTIAWWEWLLGAVQVELPDRTAANLVNRWFLYQTLSCRIWARSALYQSSGAFGFRDQLQDVMALVYAAPGLAREHILRAAARQFREGDVQHWWHSPSGAGVRTRISDDLLWLPYATAHYIHVTGDEAVLREELPFIEARSLEGGEQEAYLVPEPTDERATLYEHCRRAFARARTAGPHGLPLIGAGDWNDGLNRVGVGGKGESVWLAWFLVDALHRFAELAERYGQPADAEAYRRQAVELAATVEREAWDGNWYLRAYFDDGTPLGSSANAEARIDSLPQAWAVLCGAGDPERAARALASAWEHLVHPDSGIVQLFDPPLEHSVMDPGYVKAYPPGVRENGGQYTHGAVWLAMAFARQGDGDRAVQLLRMLNPTEHTRDLQAAARYQVEPFAVAADVYRLEGRIGQGGWTWYTGSAAWMYRAWLEEVLGLKVRGDELSLDPVIPSSWPGFKLRYRHGQAIYEFEVENPDGLQRGVAWVELDGRRLEGLAIPLEKQAIRHKVRVRLGEGRRQGRGAEPPA